MPSLRRPPLLLASAALVFVADLSLWRVAPGWTGAALALAAAGALLLVRPALRRRSSARAPLLLVGAAAAAMVWDAGLPSLLLGGFGLLLLAAAAREPARAGFADRLARASGLLPAAAWRPALDLVVLARARPRRKARPRTSLAPVLVASVLPLIFLALFAVANPVLAGWLARLGRLAQPSIDPMRPVFWAGAALVSWTVLRALAPWRRAPRLSCSGGAFGALLEREDVLVGTLAACNLVFLVQTTLDLWHLGLGAALPEGVTHAQYAQRGAYPLLVAACLAALFVLWAWRDEARARPRAVLALVVPWLLQTLGLTLGAAWRLGLYVEAYGLTRWRLAAALWMGLVAFGLAAITWRLLSGATNARLVAVNLAAAAGLLAACCFANLDGLIAQFNVAHCRELGGAGVALDVDYLESLGEEALPALAIAAHEAPDARLRMRAGQAAERLRSELSKLLEDPRAWTVRRAALAGSRPWRSPAPTSPSPTLAPWRPAPR